MNPISEISWREKSVVIDSLLENSHSVTAAPLDSGLEAEVTKICLDGTSYVLKVWSRFSKPNVECQYRLLQTLFNQGLSVSQPWGWGLNKEGHSVLLTSFDGSPVMKLNKSILNRLSKILSGFHRLSTEDVGDLIVPKHDFINYFYPHIEEHIDIQTMLQKLVAFSNMKQDKLIHGDFNLGNIMECEGKYTVIDWTNGQFGDPRYDIAWAIVLTRIYVGQRYGTLYHAAFLAENQYTTEELELFEAIAALRWILLNRIANLPKGKETLKRVRNLVKNNRHLDESFI
jgi:Ser/Thr protein kinase RdoA (MazF antagonist)